MTINRMLIAVAVIVGGGLFAAMGWSMWVMKDMMVSMARNMNVMSTYMTNMGASDGYMSTMSADMAEMSTYMRNMAGTPQQIAAYRKAHPEHVVSEDASNRPSESPCSRFQKWVAAGVAGLGQVDLSKVNVDDVHVGQKENESYMASIKRDVSEMDEHIFCMYLSMTSDMAAMRNAMNVMTPSIAGMGQTMGYMGRDMSRGVNSFTSPMSYMFNAMH